MTAAKRPLRPSAADTFSDPIRMKPASGRDVRLEAGRQLRLSLWLMMLIGVAFAAMVAATPHSDATVSLHQQPSFERDRQARDGMVSQIERVALAEIR